MDMIQQTQKENAGGMMDSIEKGNREGMSQHLLYMEKESQDGRTKLTDGLWLNPKKIMWK